MNRTGRVNESHEELKNRKRLVFNSQFTKLNFLMGLAFILVL